MNEMIKAERNKICSRKQTRMLFLAGVVLIVAYFFFFQFNYQNVFYDYDLEKMALASGFTAIEQRKEVAEIFEGKLSQNTLLTMQEKIDQAKQATVGQDENSALILGSDGAGVSQLCNHSNTPFCFWVIHYRLL
jgi:hypothetical protein